MTPQKKLSSSPMRYDIHTHALHPKVAPKVLDHLEAHYRIAPVGNGLMQDLLEREQKAGVERIVVHSAATAPAQVIPANNWALSLEQAHPEVIAFGTLHPDYPDWKNELDRLRYNNIRGLKFHPEFQNFWMDDPKLLPLMEEAQRDFIFMFHVGDRLPPKDNPSCPYKLAALMDAFPKARIIGPHLGGWLQWEHALKAIIGRDLYIDTSSSLAFIDDETLREIFRRHPREKILFGSDYPLFDPATERAELQRRMGLSDREVEEIMSNAEALFL